MDSTGRVLLGGALGAALSYLLSQKAPDRGQEAGLNHAPVAAAPPEQTTAPVFESTIVMPVFEPLVQPVPTLAPTFPFADPPVTPVAVAAPVVVAAPFEAATPDEAVATVETPVPVFAPEPPVIIAPVAPAAPVETDIVVTREFLEEPLPGSGWRSLEPAGLEERTEEREIELSPMAEERATELPIVEDVVQLPVVEESVVLPVVEHPIASVIGPGTPGTEALAQAADVAGRLPAAEALSADDSLRVDDLRSRIEETRRRIRHELEQPFDFSIPTRSVEPDWTTAPVVPTFPMEPVSEPMEMPVDVAEVEVETPPWERIVAETPVAEPIAVEPPVVVEPALALEPPVAFQPAVLEAPVFIPAAFVPVFTEPMDEDSFDDAPPVAEPVPTDLAPAAPLVAEPAEITLTSLDPMADDPVGEATGTASEVVAAESSGQAAVDYDSMKNRIESTRSRLKAKAFDAMMAGESALLGRDTADAPRASSKVDGVDDDLDQTIETSLSEEEQ